MNAAPRPLTLLALSGSLRRASFNTALLRAAADLCPAGVRLELRTLHGVPVYDGDLEAEQGTPAPVLDLREAIRAADGLLIATPEYNNSIPGVLKNGLDWVSRPPAEGKKAFFGKPTAVLGATPGGFGTVQSQDALLSVLRTLQVEMWFGGRLMVSRANTLFDAEGRLTDAALQGQLRDFLAGFSAQIRRGDRDE
ncbi:NAD(P)H-dependent oxidoreductase [Roseateles sp. DAIF2]|uniref:NADPH-dependent FMN reductase n=1 Tax=Roseateles sp. DAIF2 TaxID=2714952 RepID=UPI0018A33A95|nr:NADPH-dependent FMN reductase [Roseateles sp. DAIF2]QPF75678.1 NAD(P)H-dependent oxidoreductase [Roseateles sp. DAIF2]